MPMLGRRSTSSPTLPGGTERPASSTMSLPIARPGLPNEPGFIGWCTVPVKMQPPTSVPPEMLMIGTRRLQTCSKNQCQGAVGPGFAARST